MARAKGYHGYRGRPSKLKIFLGVLLCLVILAAAAALYLLEHVVYDENGVRHLDLELPWPQAPKDDAPDPEQPPEEEPVLDLVIQPPPGPQEIYALSVPAGPLTREVWEDARQGALLSSAVSYNAAAVTLKDSTGKIYFDSAAAPPGSVKTEEDTADVLAELTGDQSPFYSIARLSCLADPSTARAKVEDMGLQNTGKYIFYDRYSHVWLDPAKKFTRDYLAALVLEIAELGFDEVVLTDLTYPTAGKLDKINYTGEEDLSENIAGLVQTIRTALGERKILLSVELPESVAEGTPDETAGLDLEKLAPLADRIYAVTELSKAAEIRERVQSLRELGDFVPELALEDQAQGTESYLILPAAS